MILKNNAKSEITAETLKEGPMSAAIRKVGPFIQAVFASRTCSAALPGPSYNVHDEIGLVPAQAKRKES
jgi:hypothetical protein